MGVRRAGWDGMLPIIPLEVCMRLRNLVSACALLSLSVMAAPVWAQVVVVPATPVVGSSNPVSPEPRVARPTTTPCTVTLFSEVEFNDYGTRPIAYRPPACAGPWSKVVLTADFTVTKGRQYDRTAKFFLGGANIYFGTTAEPRSALSPSWHIERDVTDLSAIFHSAQTGVASIQNIVNDTYTGVIYASAHLYFYPANTANPAAAVPNEVVGLPETFVNTTTDAQTMAVTLPRNVERAYLDVIAEAQAKDEFWYTCVPNSAAGPLENCGNTGFRETEVAIDGQPAGVAPVYPWIYTGGLDPYLWEPITGIETLNFKPYRVDLTPFAGVLADGKAHTVSVSVFNASSGFDLASNLLVYTDAGARATGGAVTTDTLTLTPTVQQQVYIGTEADGVTVSGPVDVYEARSWTISGYVNTSHGVVTTTVQANNTFKNNQTDLTSPTVFKQEISQETTQSEVVTTAGATGQPAQVTRNVDWPLTVNYNYAPDASGNYFQTAYVKQGKYDEVLGLGGPDNANPIVTNETVENSDTLHFLPTGTTHDNTIGSSSYAGKDQNFKCYYRRLTAVNLRLTGVEDSDFCSDVP